MILSYPFNSIFRRKGGDGGHGDSSEGSKGSSSSSGGSKGSFSLSSSKSTLTASSSSRGGGSVTVIPSGSLFAGRLSGGASREQVYGNSRIGSGYSYGGYGTFYGGRPFPYGFYPVYIAPEYYGGDEYGPTINGNRTGGPLSTAIVQPLISSPQDSYYLIGDQASVSAVLAFLVPNCGIANVTVTNTYVNGTSVLNGTALVPHPEQVVQYYRACSFALALSSYNNSAALLSRAPASNDSAPPPLSENTPLPVGMNITLLGCINATIAATVPLLDVDSGKHRSSILDIIMILVGSTVGPVILTILVALGLWFFEWIQEALDRAATRRGRTTGNHAT